MGIFRRKNKRTIEEQNKENEKNWGKMGLSAENSEFDSIRMEAKRLRDSNVDEEYIQNWIINQLPEGRIKLNGKRIWICRSCENARKFESKEEYMSHQMSNHG